MYWDDELREKVVDSKYEDKHLSSKSEVVEYYQEAYPGKGKGGRGLAWKQALATDLLRERGITPESTDKKEYRKQFSNVSRRFDADRLNAKGDKNKTEYELLGKTLPPKRVPPKEFSYTVHVWGQIRISQWCKPVDFQVTIGSSSDFSLQGQNAQEFTEEPNVEALVFAYFYDDPGYDGWCEGPNFEIVA